MKKTNVCIWGLGAFLFLNFFTSCSVEETITPVNDEQLTSQRELSKKKTSFFSKPEQITFTNSQIYFEQSIRAESCEITDFGRILSGYFERLLNDPYFDFELVDYYAELNRKYVTFYEGENYYGENGEYDKLAKKRIRELERFWGLDREIYLNGQHTASLNDLEILTDMIESFDRTVRNRDQAYEKAQMLIDINEKSTTIPENPYFALDAFTRSSGLLVIGDGLLTSFTDIGIDGDIAFTGILSHEWWHQAQFEYAKDWDYINSLPTLPEKSKFSDLEADFAAAYFMTHKRGATYNWKRIEEYFKLSFNVGDCLTDSTQHHGTPEQRLTAARLGSELANEAQKKGFILSPEEVHQAFLEVYESLVL